MTSGCISGCVDARAPMRATYVNLYKWPESDAEFVKSVTHGSCPRWVDSYSCRQMYLRSYTFSKKQSMHVRTKKYIGRVKEKVVSKSKRKDGGERWKTKKHTVTKKVREITCAAWFTIFNSLLSCTTVVDVVDG